MKPRNLFKPMVIATLIASLQLQGIAYAQDAADPVTTSVPVTAKCATGQKMVNKVNDAAQKKVDEITERKRIHDLMVTNAQKCMHQMAKLISGIGFPTFPNLIDGLMDRLIAALMKEACKVVLKETKAVVNQIEKPFKEIDNQIKDEVKKVNGEFADAVGVNVKLVETQGKNTANPNAAVNKEIVDRQTEAGRIIAEPMIAAAGLAAASAEKVEAAVDTLDKIRRNIYGN